MSAFQLRNVSCGRVHIRASHPWYPSPALVRTRWPCHAGSVHIRGYNARPLLEMNRWCPQPHGLMASWPHGLMASWPHGLMASWPHGLMASWPHGLMASWPHGLMASWPHGLMASWPHGLMASWPHGLMASWPHGLMASWPHGLMDDSSLSGKAAEIGRVCLGMECVTACIPQHALSVRWRLPAVPLALVFRSQRIADGPGAPS